MLMYMQWRPIDDGVDVDTSGCGTVATMLMVYLLLFLLLLLFLVVVVIVVVDNDDGDDDDEPNERTDRRTDVGIDA